MSHRYRDLICDPINPRNLIDLTALGILNALAKGGTVNVFAVNNAIEAAGGDLRYKGRARKALFNIGYDLIVEQAGEYTTYKLNGTPDEHEGQARRAARNHYSRLISLGRGLDGYLQKQSVPDPLLFDQLESLRRMAAQTGASFGVTMQEVLNEMQPL